MAGNKQMKVIDRLRPALQLAYCKRAVNRGLAFDVVILYNIQYNSVRTVYSVQYTVYIHAHVHVRPYSSLRPRAKLYKASSLVALASFPRPQESFF